MELSVIIEKINWDQVLLALFTIIVTLVLALILIKIGDAFIVRLFRPRDERHYFDQRRVLTVQTLSKSILRYAVYFIVGFTILGQLAQMAGTTLQGFLAGAGLVGVALGFGAQSLVKDVITGFFILLENQYAVGEYIKTGTYSGFVEEIGLRVTKLRDWSGEYHIIPNGQILSVTNFSRGSMRALVEVGISYEEDIDRAISVMKHVSAEVGEAFKDVIVEGPTVIGVVALEQTEVRIRTVAKTKPMEQWKIERELRKRYKEAFEQEHIETPYQRKTEAGAQG